MRPLLLTNCPCKNVSETCQRVTVASACGVQRTNTDRSQPLASSISTNVTFSGFVFRRYNGVCKPLPTTACKVSSVTAKYAHAGLGHARPAAGFSAARRDFSSPGTARRRSVNERFETSSLFDRPHTLPVYAEACPKDVHPHDRRILDPTDKPANRRPTSAGTPK